MWTDTELTEVKAAERPKLCPERFDRRRNPVEPDRPDAPALGQFLERRAPAKVPEHSERHQRRSNQNRHDLADAGQIDFSRRPLPVDERAAAASNYN